ncbi:hypothetical protein ALQ04_200017 [Pseudomonas cichorii]|uniref:YD repeat-containing protein n=1 Tax=Pseudomonas cichorii TaxID=36746 RepID=A0A3M4LDV6_PSECI|nr:hypothetical protein ALQ04_200017 [Pseudomonas cichorii]
MNNEVRYLPGLEIRTNADGEILHVITVQNARALHWQAGLPNNITNDQIRYNLNDHLGSSTLELDQQGSLISQESYYPFGGTAWWAARSAVEAKYKTVRYSGKERDASGLYYYGFRYYAPWLQRWINPDPAGDVNGLNLFSFVTNNPITHSDLDGRFYEGKDDPTEELITSTGDIIRYRGLNEFPEHHQKILKDALKKTEKIYKHALYLISNHPTENDDIMSSFFGQQHADIMHHVIESWRQTHLRVSEYRGRFGKGKFVGIEAADSKDNAYINPNDPHGRVVMNVDKIKKKKLHITLGHELSHLSNVTGSEVTGPDSYDYYYLFPKDLSKLTNGENVTNQNKYRAVAEAITSGGLTRDYFSKIQDLADEFETRVRALHSAPDTIVDLDTAITEFNRDPGIIAEMSSNNADSLIWAAQQLHKRYKEKFPAGPSKRARRE